MSFSFEPHEHSGPWGSCQPKFERLVNDGPDRYFLVGTLSSGEPIRVQLVPAGWKPPG
jgi:hypothetical protein